MSNFFFSPLAQIPSNWFSPFFALMSKDFIFHLTELSMAFEEKMSSTSRERLQQKVACKKTM